MLPGSADGDWSLCQSDAVLSIVGLSWREGNGGGWIPGAAPQTVSSHLSYRTSIHDDRRLIPARWLAGVAPRSRRAATAVVACGHRTLTGVCEEAPLSDQTRGPAQTMCSSVCSLRQRVQQRPGCIPPSFTFIYSNPYRLLPYPSSLHVHCDGA